MHPQKLSEICREQSEHFTLKASTRRLRKVALCKHYVTARRCISKSFQGFAGSNLNTSPLKPLPEDCEKLALCKHYVTAGRCIRKSFQRFAGSPKTAKSSLCVNITSMQDDASAKAFMDLQSPKASNRRLDKARSM